MEAIERLQKGLGLAYLEISETPVLLEGDLFSDVVVVPGTLAGTYKGIDFTGGGYRFEVPTAAGDLGWIEVGVETYGGGPGIGGGDQVLTLRWELLEGHTAEGPILYVSPTRGDQGHLRYSRIADFLRDLHRIRTHIYAIADQWAA